MKLSGNSKFFIIIIAITLITMVKSLTLEDFQAKFLPILLSSLIFILASIGLWRDVSARGKQPAEAIDSEVDPRENLMVEWRKYLIHSAWVLGLALGIFFLGFLITIPVFILLYMRSLGTKWHVALLVSILTPALFYILFEFVLHVELYRGLVFKWLGF